MLRPKQCDEVILLAGEAGLRCGEIMTLEWTDIAGSANLSIVELFAYPVPR